MNERERIMCIIEEVTGPKIYESKDDSAEMYYYMIAMCLNLLTLISISDEIRNTTSSEYGVEIYEDACKVCKKWYNIIAGKVSFPVIEDDINNLNEYQMNIKLLKDRVCHLYSKV